MPEKAAARQEGPYAGIEQCAACHEETVAEVPRLRSTGKRASRCALPTPAKTCHGPGNAHVDAGGGKGSMTTSAALSKDKQSEMCLKCHDAGKNADWDGSLHQTRGLACGDCH